jgi:rfaE bifunctional protein nucleotidyltransferase chain/domain
VQDEKARARILASLFFVDYVTIFNEDTPYNLIKILKPDILVKGGDYKAEDIVGYDLVKASGGEVLTLNFLEGHSSSDILRKIK